MVPRRPARTAKFDVIARYGVRALIRGSSRSAASSIAACTSSSDLLNFIRPACTIRVIGVGLPEQTLIAPWTLPLMTWLLSSARSLSLSTDARNRNTARSTISAIVTTDVKRMGHMPHPPLWNAVEIAVSMDPPPDNRVQSGGGDPCKGGSTGQAFEMTALAQNENYTVAVASRDAPGRNATGNQALMRLSYKHMQLPRFIGIVDIGVAVIVIVALALPARGMDAAPAVKGNDQQQFALARAEAQSIARPDDGAASADLARRLADGGFNDWSIDVAMTGAERASASEAKWRALLAASIGFVDRKDAKQALDLVKRAVSACEVAQERGNAAACPGGDELRMKLYLDNLEAGVASGIDPRVDPVGFRKAANKAVRPIHIGPSTRERGSDNPGSATPPSP